MIDAFNNWTLPLVLEDPVLLNATMCMAAAESETRNGTLLTRRSSSCASVELGNRRATVSDYTYYKIEAVKQLNSRLSTLEPGRLSGGSICAIMFLLWAEVGHQLFTSSLTGYTKED